jgi:hypothetical protein
MLVLAASLGRDEHCYMASGLQASALLLAFVFVLNNPALAQQQVLPEKVTMLVDVNFPVPAAVNEAVQPVAAGTEVTVKSISGDKIRVAHGLGESMVAITDTDFAERTERAHEKWTAAQVEARQQAEDDRRQEAAQSAQAPSMADGAVSSTETARDTGPQIVPSEALAAYYLKNEVRAEQELKGAVLFITGSIKRIAREILGYPYVILEGADWTDVQCVFSKSDADAVASLVVGQEVVIKGEVSGKMMNIIVRDCSVERR